MICRVGISLGEEVVVVLVISREFGGGCGFGKIVIEIRFFVIEKVLGEVRVRSENLVVVERG